MRQSFYKYNSAILRVTLILLTLLLSLPHQALSEKIPASAAFADPAQTPDLEWNPAPFKPEYQKPIRYIDYAKGSDANPGTRAQPWKHHPWDSNARNKAAASSGIATYVFKKGIAYRGQLNARESGTKQTPIRLTVDPDWGSGEAVLTGADILQVKWHLCTEQEASLLPVASRQEVYCTQAPDTNRMNQLWITGESVTPIHPARFPNWRSGGFPDPRSDWLELDNTVLELEIELSTTDGVQVGDQLAILNMTGRKPTSRDKILRLPVISVSGNSVVVFAENLSRAQLQKGTRLTNGKITSVVTHISGITTLVRRLHSKALTDPALGSLTGAIIRVERPSTQQLTTDRVISNDIGHGFLRTQLRIPHGYGPRQHDRFYLEGLPQFIDQPGEFALASVQGKDTIFLRLPEDRNPTIVTIQAPSRLSIIEIKNQQYIEITGLTFRFIQLPTPDMRQAYHAALHSAAIQIRGNATHIKVSHCRFEHLENGIVAYPTALATGQILDHLSINDSDFNHIDGSAIALGSGLDRISHTGKGRLIHATVLRNRIQSTGLLPSTFEGQGAYGHGIDISGAEIVEAAHNLIRNVGGAGINVYIGSAYERSGFPQPFLRGQIHHNKVNNSLLGVQDFGGIESWNGGPMYIYNNISANPVGYRHGRYHRGDQKNIFKRGSYGVGIYLDSQYKAYVFNNIVWGYNNDAHSRIYNAAGFNEAMGFMNTVFNNTFVNFAVGIHKGNSAQHNRCFYLGNLLLDMGHSFIQQTPGSNIEYETLAYADNIFQGTPDFFGQLGRREPASNTLAEWRAFLKSRSALASQTGTQSNAPIIRNAGTHDFRPAVNSPAIDTGTKFFIPWALSRVVGEWNFYQSEAPVVVRDESLNMNETWLRSFMFQDIPRADLECPLSGQPDYTHGELENWIPGALNFDGRKQYCKIEHSKLTAGFKWTDFRKKETGSFDGNQRDTLDISTESFLIEAVLATEPNASKIGILSKHKDRGYSLDVNEDGTLLLSLDTGFAQLQAHSRIAVNTGGWHHVIVEVDRHSQGKITFYIDGKLDSTTEIIPPFETASLSNQGDFLVGKSSAGLFKGQLDFLRLSKATLADAETDIKELYEWEFNGPQLHDFTGNVPAGKSRDAGAVEFSQYIK